MPLNRLREVNESSISLVIIIAFVLIALLIIISVFTTNAMLKPLKKVDCPFPLQLIHQETHSHRLPLDPRGVGDAPVLDGHIQVDAGQHPFAGKVAVEKFRPAHARPPLSAAPFDSLDAQGVKGKGAYAGASLWAAASRRRRRCRVGIGPLRN